MEARILIEKDKILWNDFVSTSHHSSILQSWEWGEIKGGAAWQPIRLALFDGNLIKAGISILKRRLPLGRSLLYAPRGPIVDFSDEKLLDALLLQISIEGKKNGAIALKIDPEVEEGGAVEGILRKRGFIKKSKQVQPRATFYVDLTKDPDDLIKAFEEKTRYNIRLSEKKGVTVREMNSDEGVETFYKIYQETAQRERFLIHPVSYYKRIKKVLVDQGLASIFIAYHEGRAIGGVYIFRFGDKAWYMYGASVNDGRNVMPNHALHWHVIKWAKEKGLKTYDLWGIPSNPTESHPLWGVYRFKKGFNGRLVKYIGVYDFPFDPILYHVFDSGTAIFQNLRSLITKGKIEDSLAE